MPRRSPEHGKPLYTVFSNMQVLCASIGVLRLIATVPYAIGNIRQSKPSP